MPVSSIPRTPAEAVDARAEEPGRTVVAGATDLMVAVNAGRSAPSAWLSLARVADWRSVDRDRDRWRIGAAVRLAELERAPAGLALLSAAVHTIGSRQIRNLATIGGNLGTASPAGDTLPALLCLDAVVELVSVRGTRTLPLAEFLTGPKRTSLAPDELIAAVVVDDAPGPTVFSKHATRAAMTISRCTLAAVHHAGSWRVATGAVAPTARRAPDAERLLDEGVDAETFAAAVIASADPIDDHRSSAAHRRHVLGVQARRSHRDLVTMR